LKPANIKLKPDGSVKVLDFGLAKALAPAAAGVSAGGQTFSPTITSPAMTQAGVIVGTAAYMAPEQAKGREADKRSDVWPGYSCAIMRLSVTDFINLELPPSAQAADPERYAHYAALDPVRLLIEAY
jgi:serine/threonine protein kinase